VDDELVASGRYARLEIAARDGGPPTQRVTVGFVGLDDGAIVVAATAPDARWARSLADVRRARITMGDRSFDASATELTTTDPVRSAAVRDLILRYGTPSEGLGRGPVFRLDPLADR
jgi:hypothetical protein